MRIVRAMDMNIAMVGIVALVERCTHYSKSICRHPSNESRIKHASNRAKHEEMCPRRFLSTGPVSLKTCKNEYVLGNILANTLMNVYISPGALGFSYDCTSFRQKPS